MPNPRGKIKKDRALQISNNVSEEFLDHGQTNFATKAELCETILWLGTAYGDELRRKDAALRDIATKAIEAAHYPIIKS